MKPEVERHEPRAERLEKTRTITAEDLRFFHELEVLKLPPPDRNFVVALRKRDIEDKQTSNRKRQEKYLLDNLGIKPDSLSLKDGTPLKKNLVTETVFSWIAAAHAINNAPQREPEILQALNETVKVQDLKHTYVESGTIKELSAHGLSFFRTTLSLPRGALQVMWETLETALKEKNNRTLSAE